MEEVITELENVIYTLKSRQTVIEKKEEDSGILKQQLAILFTIKDYDRINWQYHVEKIHQLEQERYELLHNNNILALLHKKRDEVEFLLSEAKEKESATTEKVGALKGEILNYQGQLSGTDETIKQVSQFQKENFFSIIEERLTDKAFRLPSIDKQQEQFRKRFEGDTGELKRLRYKLSSLRSAIEKQMREIKEHSKAEYSEIGENIDARTEYILKFEKLVSEDLNRHEERVKEALNQNTINSIDVFDKQLEKHQKEITQKLKKINQQ